MNAFRARLVSLTIVTALLITGGLAACGQGTSPTAVPSVAQPSAVPSPTLQVEIPSATPTERQRTLVVAYRADIVSFDPAIWYDVEGGDLLQGIYEQLVRYKPGTSEIGPWLAKSWDLSDDHTQYTFHLQEGVSFQDGTPFNAEAMKSSMERYKSIGQGPAWYLDLVQSIDAVDDHTLKVTLSEPQSNFLDLMAGLWGLKAISPTAVKAHEVDGDLAQAWLKENAVGTGPYTLQSVEWGQRYVLEKNDNYWGGWDGPHVDRIDIEIIPEISTQRMMLQQGDLDLVTHSVPFSELEAMAQTPGLKVLDFPSNQLALVILNVVRPPLDNVKVRQALAWSFPYDVVLSEVGGGHILKVNGAFPNGFEGSGVANPYHQDLDKAKQLLTEAGYPNGGFSVEWGQYPSEAAEFWKKIAQLWQADLTKLGVTLTIREIPVSVAWEEVQDPQTFVNMFAMELTPDAADPYSWATLIYRSTGAFNWGYYNSPELDQVLDTALVTVDQSQRTKLYEQVATQVMNDAAYIFVAQMKDEMVMRQEVQGIEQIPAEPWCINYYHAYLGTNP